MKPESQTIDVAVGVAINDNGEVLVSFRHPDLHQGNLWEFPGGKLEAGESVLAALQREMREELGLQVLQAFPLKTIRYRYPDESVALHVWRITAWEGEAQGLEGQAIAWKPIGALAADDFPAANVPILRLLHLPAFVAITPVVDSQEQLRIVLQQLLAQGLQMIQLRQPQLSAPDYQTWFQAAEQYCRSSGAILFFSGDPGGLSAIGVRGYHANSSRLMALQSRPVSADCWFSASCHSLEELRQAEALQADFVSLSPVARTAKYPPGHELGWHGFRRLREQVNLPVYALGGLQHADLAAAQAVGAQGIAGISLFLS